MICSNSYGTPPQNRSGPDGLPPTTTNQKQKRRCNWIRPRTAPTFSGYVPIRWCQARTGSPKPCHVNARHTHTGSHLRRCHDIYEKTTLGSNLIQQSPPAESGRVLTVSNLLRPNQLGGLVGRKSLEHVVARPDLTGDFDGCGCSLAWPDPRHDGAVGASSPSESEPYVFTKHV